MNEELQAGQVVLFDDYSDVEILAIAGVWAMLKRVRKLGLGEPFVMHVYDLKEQIKAMLERAKCSSLCHPNEPCSVSTDGKCEAKKV